MLFVCMCQRMIRMNRVKYYPGPTMIDLATLFRACVLPLRTNRPLGMRASTHLYNIASPTIRSSIPLGCCIPTTGDEDKAIFQVRR